MCVHACVFFLFCEKINPKIFSQLRGEESSYTVVWDPAFNTGKIE